MDTLLPAVNKCLNELIILLRQLPAKKYAEACPELSNATIGEHTRHIIEMFLCLLQQCDSGIVNYDLRERNGRIETDAAFAIQSIDFIQQQLQRDNHQLALEQIIDGKKISIQTNYLRELLYNLEHCIHHQALIKVALLKCENLSIDQDFGVARSTIEYRNQCAQ